jgi:DNA invertase Pin-like site-specific DNA recombinase
MSKDKSVIIPAVGYLRKSTKEEGYEKSLADQKARIQKMKPMEEGARYQILDWYTDPGIQGWKRGHKRPDYFRMVNRVRDRRDVKAVLVDDMDRFSRADPMETVSDVQALRELGIRYIHAANQGVKDLTRDVAMVAMKIAMEANASHEHCTRLSRRITSTRLQKALEGKRTGSVAPYGLAHDGKYSLKAGDPKSVKVVCWLFEEFANHARSLNWLAGDLNARKVPGPTGGCWYVNTIAHLLRRKCYRGAFEFNREPSGQFYAIDARGEVVEKGELNGIPGKVILKEGIYKPLVEPALFDRVQRKLDLLAKNHRWRKRVGYALSGLLVCDHCGTPMHGCKQHGDGSAIIYRCNSDAQRGRGACGYRQVREDRILPFLLRVLGEEITDLVKMLATPPESLCHSSKERNEHRQQRERDREKLAERISTAVENIMFVKDRTTRQDMDARITSLRDELARLDAELAAEPSSGPYIRDVATGKIYLDNSKEDAEVLAKWWKDFNAKAVSMPVDYFSEKHQLPPLVAGLSQDPFADERAVLVDPRAVNEALHELGTEVRLRWDTREYKTCGRKIKIGEGQYKKVPGVDRKHHELTRGRFRLGQQNGKLPRSVLESPALPR